MVLEACIPSRGLLLEVRLVLDRLSQTNCDLWSENSKSGTLCIRSMGFYLYYCTYGEDSAGLGPRGGWPTGVEKGCLQKQKVDSIQM